MFKKLKDKIAEEVKISPQRMQQIQQFTQSMTDKLQQGLEQGTTSPDDGLFSISEDDSRDSRPVDSGFANVPLQDASSTPEMPHRKRRNSNSSISSDVSFLPRYESSMNSYYVQSDLDVSASEVEDNLSVQSSSLGHVSKEQLHIAFQKSQLRYHKYRGRYTDLANHYRELERENTKMKAVLVETQDKAIQRVSELKEQCSLSQAAKADIESALRIEIEEKIIIINTLKQKVDLLQCSDELNRNDTTCTGNDVLLVELNEKLQEYKAGSIVSKEKLITLQRELDEAKKCLLEHEEREKNNNFKFAKSKMDLHTELQNRELEITNLKQDLETVRSDLEVYEKGGGLKAQNANLIDKCETLKARNHELEADLLKTVQYKMEIHNLHQRIKEHEEANIHTLDTLRKAHADELKAIQEDTKQSLVSLQEKMKNAIADEYQQKEVQLKEQFAIKLEQLNQAGDTLKQTQIKLMQAEDAVRRYEVSHKDDRESISALTEKNMQLEKNYIVLMEENNGRQSEIAQLCARIRRGEEEKEICDEKTKKFEERIKKQGYTIQKAKERTKEIERELGDKLMKKDECVEEAQRRNQWLVDQMKSINARMIGTDMPKEETHKQGVLLNHIQAVNDQDSDSVIQNLIANDNAIKCRLGTLQRLCDDQKAEIAKLTESLGSATYTNQLQNEEQRKRLEGKQEECDTMQAHVEKLEKNEALLKIELSEVTMKNKELENLGEDKKLTAQLSELSEMKNTAEARWRIEKEQLIQQLEELTRELQSTKEIDVERSRLFEAKCDELKSLQCAYDETNVLLRNAEDRDQQAQFNLERLTEGVEALKTQINIHNNNLQASEKQGLTLTVELQTLQARNDQLSMDNKRLMDENDKLLSESSDIMLQLATKITNTDAEVAAKLADVTTKYAEALNEATEAKEALLQKEVSALDGLQYEKHIAELMQERQFLKDEIEELKTTPLNSTTTSEAANIAQKDVETLQAKLAQYKSIDQTNRSSIEFYENELQRLKSKNEKLNRKLDETLVTLNHCVEISTSTEVQYLKNVVYNYMMGRESVMMAKVIAAVCKFDTAETEIVMKHEQQKQTLLGQLGIL